jgi:hypothetical protein
MKDENVKLFEEMGMSPELAKIAAAGKDGNPEEMSLTEGNKKDFRAKLSKTKERPIEIREIVSNWRAMGYSKEMAESMAETN